MRDPIPGLSRTDSWFVRFLTNKVPGVSAEEAVEAAGRTASWKCELTAHRALTLYSSSRLFGRTGHEVALELLDELGEGQVVVYDDWVRVSSLRDVSSAHPLSLYEAQLLPHAATPRDATLLLRFRHRWPDRPPQEMVEAIRRGWDTGFSSSHYLSERGAGVPHDEALRRASGRV